MTAKTLRCTVESMNYSACGMVPGDFFEVDGDGQLSIPNGRPFCYFAIAQVVPFLNGRQGDVDGEDWLDSKPLLACPDPPEALYMRLERLPAAQAEHAPDTDQESAS